MNNRRRNLRKAMLNTYVEGKVWSHSFLYGYKNPMKADKIRHYINLAIVNNVRAPFYYSAVRGRYMLNFDSTNIENRIKFEQMDFACKAAGFPVNSDADKRKKWLERRMRLVIENSLYGADGLTEQELLAKKG